MYLSAEDGFEPPNALGVVGSSVGLRWGVTLRGLVELTDVVPFLHRLLHQSLVCLFLNLRRPAQYPEITPGGLADHGVLVIGIDIEHPVVAGDGNDWEERREVEPDFELGLVTLRIGLVGAALDETPLPSAPSLVQDVHRAVGVKGVGGAGVDAVLRLEPGRERSNLVPTAHVSLQVEPLHHFHRFLLCHLSFFSSLRFRYFFLR
uniref:Uncharacterized protein n=1 Tax=Noccaea caerulescens TaxID=107243 RepID=A0A1J3GUS8_NOCCA